MSETFLARQQALFSPEERARIRAATVLVAGLGGLGSFVAEGLCRAGVGSLILIDQDRVSPSDLNRQILYTANDLGNFKAQAAKKRLLSIRDDLWVEAWVQDIKVLKELPDKVSLVIDALDNWEARFYLDGLALKAKKYLVHAGLTGLFGQVATLSPAAELRLPDIFKGAGEGETQATFSICAVLAALQIEEALKIICARKPTLLGKLLLVDLVNYGFEIVPLVR